jgi:hypothetical protein
MSTLFQNLAPLAAPKGIDLRCCDVREMLATVRGARLLCADPPWLYSREAGVANPETNGIYSGMSESDIAAILDASYDSAGADARLAVWYTWPKDAEWTASGGAGFRWGARVTGGAWTKHPMPNGGVGYHWRGKTEPVALFTKGAAGRADECIYNGWISPPTDHSEKPVDWMRSWLRAWTAPGDTVCDLWSGLAPLARACYAEGRRYVGAEIDPERHDKALARLAAYRGTL